MSDPFEALPDSPNGNASAARASQRTQESSISVLDIQDFISPKLYSELSWDENRSADDVTKSCIDRALVVTETLLHLAGQALNLYSKTQKEVVKALTVYELYLYNGDKNSARSYMEKAERLISNRYGSLEHKRDEAVPVAAICLP